MTQIKWWKLIQINDTAVTGATGMEWCLSISHREKNWKLFQRCDIIPCNITNYLNDVKIKRINATYCENFNPIPGHTYSFNVFFLLLLNAITPGFLMGSGG